MQTIFPCLWFDNQAEAAANFYVSVFPKSKLLDTTHYGEGMPLPAGSVLTVTFELNGQRFMALNGGPMFQFSEAISFVVPCATQSEIDLLWDKLLEGGVAQQCGWLKDRFGVSWQIIPEKLNALLFGSDPAGSARAMQAMLQMVKLDLATLEQAYRG